MEKLKQIYAGLLLIFSLFWILLHLWYIQIGRKVEIKEDNKWVLKLELAVMSLLVLFGVERFIKVVSTFAPLSINGAESKVVKKGD